MHVVNMGLTQSGIRIKTAARFRQIIGRDGSQSLFKYEDDKGQHYNECVQQRVVFRDSVTLYLCLSDNEGVPYTSTMWTPHDIERTLDISPYWWRDNTAQQPTELVATLKEFEGRVRQHLQNNVPDTNAQIKQRIRFIKEECDEVLEALENLRGAGDDKVKEARAHLLKELADLTYVVAGTAENLKLDLDTAFMRVHASNMSKDFSTAPSGKILKGKQYVAPDLKDLV